MSPEGKPSKPVAIYTRVSEQGDRSDEEMVTHEVQRKRCEEYLSAKGMTASTETFEDTDKSGGKLSRPAFDRAIAGVLEGRYGGIAVAYLDRFARNRDSTALMDRIEEAGGVVIALDFDFDTSTAMGRAMRAIIVAFNALVREQTAEKVQHTIARKLSKLEAGEEGGGIGGVAPAGYEFSISGLDSNGKPIRNGLVPTADAPVIRAAFELAASGGTSGQVADLLNARGVKTRRGRDWTADAAQGLLRNEVYTGVRVYGDRRVEEAHAEIVPGWLWRKVQPQGPKTTRTRGEGHPLGEGLVRCGKCERGLTKGLANGKFPTLRCQGRGGGHPSIGYGLAYDYIVDVVLDYAGAVNVERREGGNVEAFEAAGQRVEDARAAVAEIEAQIGVALPVGSVQRVALTGAEDALASLGHEDEGIVRTFALDFGRNREAFDEFSAPDKRRALRLLGAERVVLLEGSKGDAGERLRIEFEDGTVVGPDEYRARKEAASKAGKAALREWAKA